MTWEEICADPTLQDVPYKIETNERGQIVMSPLRGQHGRYQYTIGNLLEQFLPHGFITTECPVRTTAGVRVPDVVWNSPERDQADIYTLAPEVCVEILSPYNNAAEMVKKRALYFEAGAIEVWVCDENGAIRFFGPNGELSGGSIFCAGFPAKIKIRSNY